MAEDLILIDNSNNLTDSGKQVSVLSNIIEMTVDVILYMSKKDVALTYQGDTLNRSVLTSIVGSKLKNRLIAKKNGRV